ncbi:MAG: 50S ribosomal protein L17 [Acidobacteriota bacterium]|nr:50S ribosomal protein L17 [Acidobacteriota bacterium]
MRHAVRGRKLGRTSAHREALFRNQLQSLVAHERIVTTLPKAKELRPLAEKVITHGKQDTVQARRWVLRWVLNRDLVKRVFDDISPRFAERPGGYLRIIKLGPRQGDGAEMAILEVVDRDEVGAVTADAKESAKPAKGKAAPKAPKKAAREKGEGKQPGAKRERDGGRDGGGKTSGKRGGRTAPTRQKTG